MSRQKISYLCVGVALGFVLGFALANGINRRSQDEAHAEVARLRAGSAGSAKDVDEKGNLELKETAERVRQAVSVADSRPADLNLQKDYGRGTYLYAVQTGDTTLLKDAARLLQRAHNADPKDYDTTVLLGNALFDLAQSGGEVSFAEARAYYLKALQTKPDDVNVRTDLGNTYFYDRPPDPRRAIGEYRKSLRIDPRHEMTLQNLVAALTAAGDLAEAEERLGELEKVNPDSRVLPNLRAQLEQKKNASKERE